jgi:hypothetical protein
MYADKYLHRRRRYSLTFGGHAFGLVIGPINRAVFTTSSFSPRLKVYLLSTLGIVAVYMAVHRILSVCQVDSPDLVTAITPSFLNALPLVGAYENPSDFGRNFCSCCLVCESRPGLGDDLN